mgnify:CR=1 FL=1
MGEEKKGFFSRLKAGLTKTRDNIVHSMDSVFGGFSNIDDDFYEELEEILIMGDIGVNATEEILERLKKQVREKHIKEPAACREHLINSISEQMEAGETAYDFENERSVVMVIGVNGVGKTTTVGKLAAQLKGQGKKVLIAASLLKPAHLYIWDEPLNYIDVFSRMQIEKLILTFQPTMLIVEHDVRFREKIATRVVEM